MWEVIRSLRNILPLLRGILGELRMIHAELRALRAEQPHSYYTTESADGGKWYTTSYRLYDEVRDEILGDEP